MTSLQPYEAALKQGAAYLYQQNAGFLRVAGRDQVDFLQRQTTNDLRVLASDRSVSTVLTSPTARILDLFCVLDHDDALGLVTLPGRFTATLKFLRSRIFFSDEVSVDNRSADFAQIILWGPQVKPIFNHLDFPAPALDHITQLKVEKQLIVVIRQDILGAISYRFLVPATYIDTFSAVLDQAGAARIDAPTFEILRVEAGQPGPEGELVEAYTPLEVGLHNMISDSKGCYTGQEIIARQITYDKVAKKLVKMQLGMLAMAGAAIKAEGKTAGTLTSVVQSPRFGPVGLGVVRRQYSEVGTSLSIFSADDVLTTAEVIGTWDTKE